MQTHAPGTFPGLIDEGCPVVVGDDYGLVWRCRGSAFRVFWTRGPLSGTRQIVEARDCTVPLLQRHGRIAACLALAEHLDLPEVDGLWSDGTDEDGRRCWYLGQVSFGAFPSADHVIPGLLEVDPDDDTEHEGYRIVDAAALAVVLRHFEREAEA